MNVWAIVAILAALVFGFCVGYIVANLREKRYIDALCRRCSESAAELAKVSKEYEEFVKAAHEIDRWPKNNTHITMKDNLADYLKAKYLSVETEFIPDCEDEGDNLYI